MDLDLDAKAPRQFPKAPRAQIDQLVLLPALFQNGDVIPGTWLRPGGRGETITTPQLEVVAQTRKTTLTITYKE